MGQVNLGHVRTCTRVPKSRILPVVMRDKASVAIGMFLRCRTISLLRFVVFSIVDNF